MSLTKRIRVWFRREGLSGVSPLKMDQSKWDTSIKQWNKVAALKNASPFSLRLKVESHWLAASQ